MQRKTIAITAGLLIAAGASAVVGIGAAMGERGERFGGGWGGRHGQMHGDVMGEDEGGGRGWGRRGGRQHGMHGGPWGGHGGRHEGRRGGGRGMGLQRLDADKDGKVTLDEFMAPKAGRFAKLDANGDGVVDAGELDAPMRERREFQAKQLMQRLDADKDGKVTLDEFQRGPRERFSHRDLNNDGRLDDADMPPWHRRRAIRDRDAQDTPGSQDKSGDAQAAAPGEDRGERSGWRGRHGGRGKHGMHGERSLEDTNRRSADRFKALDRNGDGVLDASEFAAAAGGDHAAWVVRKRLHMLDKDRDGKISKDEYAARARQRFADADLDGDGSITAKDLPPGMARRMERGAGEGGREK